MMQKEQPQAWWFDSHNLARPSPWLGNTLSELDDKTKQMLKLIDQDADSFAQRAEMYYKKRPVLVDMLGDLYRAHRSLAEQCDLLKHGGGTRRSTVFASPSPCNKSWSLAASMDGKAGAGSSSSSTSLCSGSSYDSESEVDDPEEEDHHHGDHQKVHHHHHHGDHQKVSEGETEAEKKKKKEQQPEQQQEAAELMEEIRRLKEQNSELQKAMEESTAMFKAELAAKDEEKREVIRQLAASLDVVQGENSTLRECIKSSNHHHRRPAAARAFDLRKLTRDLFSAKLFTAHCKPSGPVVAL